MVDSMFNDEQELIVSRACGTNIRVDEIFSFHAPAALARFAQKSLDYGDAADELGVRAQFVDINRKIRKLKRALWDGEELVGEQPVEILDDLIAHCLLAREMLTRTEANKASRQGRCAKNGSNNGWCDNPIPCPVHGPSVA
jgi:hypothetical protein